MCEGCCLCAAEQSGHLGAVCLMQWHALFWCTLIRQHDPCSPSACPWFACYTLGSLAGLVRHNQNMHREVQVGGLFLHVTVQTSKSGDTYLGFGLAQVKSINHCPGPLCYVCTQRTSRHDCRLNRQVQPRKLLQGRGGTKVSWPSSNK